MNKITKVTRGKIFDSIIIERINWNGSLEEPEFLSRVFDLRNLPSYDSRYTNMEGDVWQHRINNYDWEEYWVFTDDRLNLMDCDDALFLQFLCEMVHPVVRRDKTEVARLVQSFNEGLKYDGYELVEKAQISGHSIFGGRRVIIGNEMLQRKKREIENVLSEEYVIRQINIMESSVESSPELAIGTSKELIETICKTILHEREIEIERGWDLPKLLRETASNLKLAPGEITNEVKAADTIKKILGSLSTVVFGIAELRNNYGTGHGKDAKFKGLNSRHARLATGASSTLALFLLETHKIREEIELKEK
ncbi:MAG: abortive infection family protein [Bacteroidia bacterium]|nr:abortive infection family protein [Bacteroidia bacterium]